MMPNGRRHATLNSMPILFMATFSTRTLTTQPSTCGAATTCALPTSWPILWHLSPRRQRSHPRSVLRRLALAFATKHILGFLPITTLSMNIAVRPTSRQPTCHTLWFKRRRTFVPFSHCTSLTRIDYPCLITYRQRPSYTTLKKPFLQAAQMRKLTPIAPSPWKLHLTPSLSRAADSRRASTASAHKLTTSVVFCTRIPRCAPVRAATARSHNFICAPAALLCYPSTPALPL